MDNKLFWRTINRTLSDKFLAGYRINLTGKCQILKTELKKAKTLLSCLANIIKTLKISK